MTKRNTNDDAVNEPERDPWFNPHLGPHGIRAHEVIGSVVAAVENYGRERALRAKDRDTYSRVLIPLVANLIHHNLTGSRGQGIPVPRSNKALGVKGNRYQPFSFPRSFPKMLKGLRDLGFAKVTIGMCFGME